MDIINFGDILNTEKTASPDAVLPDGSGDSAFTADNLAAPSISGEGDGGVPAFGENIGNLDAANATEADVAAFKAKAEAKLPAYEKEAWRYGNSADFSRLRTEDTTEAEHRYLIEEGKKKAHAFRRASFNNLIDMGVAAASPWQGFTTDGVLDDDKIPQSVAEGMFGRFARVFPYATDSTVLQENFGTTDRAEIGRRVLKSISRAAESDVDARRRWEAADDMEAVRDELRQLGVLAGIPEEMQTNPIDIDEAVQTRRYYVNKMGGINELVLSSVESVEEFGEAFALSMMTEDKQKKVIADVLSRDPAKAWRIIQAASAYAAYADAGFFASSLRFAESVFEGGRKGLSSVWNATKDAFSGGKKNAEDDVFYAMNDAWINDEGGSAMLTAGDIDSMSDEDVMRLAGDAAKKKTYSNKEQALLYRERITGKPSGVSFEYSAGEIREMYKRGNERWVEAFSGAKVKELGAPQFRPENWLAETSYGFGYSVGYMVPGLVGGAAAAALTKNPSVPVAIMASYWGASGYGEQMEAWLSSGDVTTGRAERRLSGAIYGGILAVTGTIGAGAVAAGGRAMLGGAAGRLASTSFGRGVSTFMNRGALRFAKHAVNDDTALFLLRYGNGSVAQRASAYLARTAGSATVASVVEGGTEVIEEVAMAAARDAVSDERSKTFSGGDAGVDWESVTDSLAEVFKLGSITGLVLSGVMRAPATVSEARSMLRKREELDGKNIFTATQERLAVLVAARQAESERARKGVKASPDGEGAAALPDAEVIRMVLNAEGEEARSAAYANERFDALSEKDKAFVRTLAEVYDMSDSQGKAQIQSVVSDAGVFRAGEEYFTKEEMRKVGELIGLELRRGDMERGIRDDEAMLDGMKKELAMRQYEVSESEADIEPRASREYGFLTDAELGQNIRVGERVVSGNREELAKLKNKIENFTIFTAGTAERTRAATKSAHAAYITGDTEEARERRNILREMRREGTSTEFFDEVGEIIGIDWDAEEDSPRVRSRKAAEEAAEAARKAAEDARKAAEEAERRMAELRAERRRQANEMKRGAQRAGVEIAEEIVRLIQADADARAEAEYLGTEAANRIIEVVRAEERARNAEQLRKDREQYRETAEEEARRRAWEEEQLVSRNEELARINAQIAAQRAITQAKRLASDEAERKLRASLETPNAVPVQTDKRGEEILKIVKSGGDAAEEIMARGWASNRAEAWMLVSMALIGQSERVRNAIVKARDSKFTEAVLENEWKAYEAGLHEDFEDAVVWYAENKERMSELVARMAKGNIFFKAFVNDFASRDYQAMSRFFSYYVYLVRARVYREGLGESRFAHPIVNLTNQMLGVVSYAASRAGVSNDFDADVQYKLMDVNAERAYPTEEEVRIILNNALERSKDIIEPYVEEHEPMGVDVSDDVRRELGLAGASFPAGRGINTGLADEINRLEIDAADYASTEASGGDVEAQDAANEAASQGVSADEAAASVAAEASRSVPADDAAESSNKKRAKSVAAAQEVAGIAVRDNAERQISETKRMEKAFSEKKRSTRIPFVPTVVVEGVTESTVRAKMPYKITGNKASIIGRHSGVFAALGKLAQAQGGRVVDAFFGAGVYTHFLSSQNALPKGSVINEYDRSRYITNRNIRDDAAGVKRALTDILRRWESSEECAAFKRNIETYNSRVKNRKRGETVNFLDAYSENTILKWINDELGGKHGVSYAEEGKLRDSANTSAMYLFLQSRAARGRVVSLDYDAKSGRAFARYGDTGHVAGGDVSQGFVRIDNDTRLGRYKSPYMSLNESGALNAVAEKAIDEASRNLSGKEILNGDGWKVAMPEDMGGVARKGDVVFVDPPYWYTMGYSKGNKGAAHNDAERQIEAVRRFAEEGNKRGITYVFTNEYGFYGYGSSSVGRDVNLDEEIVPALENIRGSRLNKAVRRGTGGVNMDVVFVSGIGRFLLAPSKKEMDASGEKNAGKAYAKLNETMEGELPDAVKPLMRDWNRAATKNVLFQKATEVFTGTRDARLQDKLRRFGAWLERAGVTVNVMSDEDFDNRVRELSAGIRYSLGGGTSTIRDDSGVVYGYYNRATKEIGIREGARADTLVHELGWHATYDWASANAPELYEQMRRYALSAPDEIKEAVASAYGYADGVIDEEAFLDEAGAAFFSKEHNKAIEDAIDAIEDSSLRGRARRWWHAFRELLFKAWTKLVGTYSRYYTADGKRKVDLKGILKATDTAQEAVAGIADAFAKGQILADYADAYKRQNPQETTRGDVLGWAARNRGGALADAVLSGVRFQRGFTDAAKVIEYNRAEAEKAATRILSSNRQHQQWADILLGGWQDFVESGTSKGGLIEARRFDVLNAKIMSERHKALAESDAAKIAQARVEHSAKRAPSREAARIVAEYDIPLFDGTKGWSRRVYEIISEREPDKEHARSLASVVWAEQFSRVSNDILSASKSVDVHDIIDRILSGKGSLSRQLRRAEKIEDILIDKNEAQLVAAMRKSMRNLLESHKGQFKAQKRTEDRAYYGGTELFLRNVARYGLARNGERWQEYFEREAEKARGELTSASEPVRLEAMGKLRALDLWWGKSFTEMDAAELVAMERYIADVASEGKAIREQALAAKKESAERAWRDVAAAAGESAATKGGDPNREEHVRNFLAFGQSVRSKLESAVRFASEEKYKKAVDAVRDIDLRITEANNAAAGMLTDAEHAFMSALLKLAGKEDKITPKKSGASYVRMSRAAEKILFDMILTRPEGSERFSARGEKLTWAELTAQYLMMSQAEWADMYSNVDAETASNPEWRAKNPAYERFVKLGELEAFLGEKRVEFARAASDILQSFDTRIDAQSIKDTGVSLSYKRGRGYFPIVHSMKDYMSNLTPSIAGGTPALVPKILIPRQHSRIDIDEHADVFSLFRRQAYDITHYIAHGEAGTSSDIRALLSSEDYAAFREDIAKVGGASAANALWAHLNQVLAGRLEGAEFYSNLDGGINKAFAVLRWLTRAAGLGFNIVSGLKSAMGGIPSYINHYGFGATLYAMARAIPNGNVVFTEDFKEILDSDGYKQRYGNNAMNRVLAAARMPKVIPPKLAMRLMRTETNMMTFTSYGDRIPLFLVGSSIYSAMKNHYIAEGKTIEEAKRLAMRDFWQVQDATQQARQIQNMDALTRSGSSVLKVFAQFLTSPMQFISDQIHAVETLAARKDLESFKRLQTIMIHNHILQPGAMFLAALIAEAIIGGTGDEDDSLFNDEDAAAFLLGSMSAIPLLGGAIEWAVMTAVADDNPYYTANMFAPSASETGSKIAQRTTKLIEKIVDGEEGEAKEAAIKLAESFAAVRYFNRAYDKYVAEEDGE